MMAFPAHRWISVTTRDGTAAGVFAGLHGLRIGGDLVQRLALETVEHPPSLPPIADQCSVLQHFQMKGESRLRDFEDLLELADTAFLVRQHFDDLNAGFIGQGMEPTGNDGGVGAGGSCHRANISTLLDMSRYRFAAAGEGTCIFVCPWTYDLGKGDHVLERLAAETMVLPTAVAPFPDQSRFSEHFQVVGDGGLRSVEEAGQLGHGAVALRQEFQDLQPRGVGDRVKPLAHVRKLDSEGMRGCRQPRSNQWHFPGNPKQPAAAHTYHPKRVISTIMDMGRAGGADMSKQSHEIRG